MFPDLSDRGWHIPVMKKDNVWKWEGTDLEFDADHWLWSKIENPTSSYGCMRLKLTADNVVTLLRDDCTREADINKTYLMCLKILIV